MPLKIGNQMPSLEGATTWFSTNESSKYPLIMLFWAVSCPICKMNMPRLQELTETYADKGLRLVSVHMPRMEADMDVEKVKIAMEEMSLTGACAIDNDHILGDRFETGGVWPCYFLFDAEGKLRSRAAGALGLKMAENSLKRLLGEVEEPAMAGVAQ